MPRLTPPSLTVISQLVQYVAQPVVARSLDQTNYMITGEEGRGEAGRGI